MKNTRVVAIAAIVVLAVAAGFAFADFSAQPSVASIRSNIANSGKLACFNNARPDLRNVFNSDAKLTAYCACTLDRSVAAMNDAEVREAAANESTITDAMRVKLAASAAACKAQVLE